MTTVGRAEGEICHFCSYAYCMHMMYAMTEQARDRKKGSLIEIHDGYVHDAIPQHFEVVSPTLT